MALKEKLIDLKNKGYLAAGHALDRIRELEFKLATARKDAAAEERKKWMTGISRGLEKTQVQVFQYGGALTADNVDGLIEDVFSLAVAGSVEMERKHEAIKMFLKQTFDMVVQVHPVHDDSGVRLVAIDPQWVMDCFKLLGMKSDDEPKENTN